METDLAYCENNISCNPDFAGPGDYRLLPGSCLIDTGTSYHASSIDYHGDSRPFGSGYDIGADEFTGPFVRVNGMTGFFIALILLTLYTGTVMRWN